MTLSKKQRIFSLNIAKLINYAFDNCIELTFGEVWRPLEMQKIYLANGKSKTLKSSHLNRLAVDFNFFIDNKLTYNYEDLKILGDFWISLNPANVWGGDFNKNNIKDGFLDTSHFEMKI